MPDPRDEFERLYAELNRARKELDDHWATLRQGEMIGGGPLVWTGTEPLSVEWNDEHVRRRAAYDQADEALFQFLRNRGQ